MLYVQQSLTPDEELIHIGHFHWMYTFKAIMAAVNGLIGCIVVLVGAVYFLDHYWVTFTHKEYVFTHDNLLGRIRELHPAVRLGAFFCFSDGSADLRADDGDQGHH